jgi:transposase InsO family protein
MTELAHLQPRLTNIVKAIGFATSTWFRRKRAPSPELEIRRGPQPKPIQYEAVEIVLGMAWSNPWYGYKRIAVMCRRCGYDVFDRDAYRVMATYGLLQEQRPRPAELYQAAKLFELLPKSPNELWQTDVTYVHIPGHGWWYAVTVIDYFSRYLLALHFCPSYSAEECVTALQKAHREAERICGPLKQAPFVVTDNGSSFIAKRFGQALRDIGSPHVRINYRTPTQLGLLERFHGTMKREEVYWHLYSDPGHARTSLAEFHERYNCDRPHWALLPPDGGDPLTPHQVYASGRAIRIPEWQKWAKAAKAQIENELGRSIETLAA